MCRYFKQVSRILANHSSEMETGDTTCWMTTKLETNEKPQTAFTLAENTICTN